MNKKIVERDNCDDCGKFFPIEQLIYLGNDYMALCVKCEK